jgi:hypothetical protein
MKRTVAFISGVVVLGFAGLAHAQNLDFQCFKAKDQNKAFVKTSASVTDTYAGTTVTDFKKPFLLCDSASIAGSPNSSPSSRLSCFKVKGAKLVASQSSAVTDDFGSRLESYQKVFVVCDTATAVP